MKKSTAFLIGISSAAAFISGLLLYKSVRRETEPETSGEIENPDGVCGFSTYETAVNGYVKDNFERMPSGWKHITEMVVLDKDGNPARDVVKRSDMTADEVSELLTYIGALLPFSGESLSEVNSEVGYGCVFFEDGSRKFLPGYLVKSDGCILDLGIASEFGTQEDKNGGVL